MIKLVTLAAIGIGLLAGPALGGSWSVLSPHHRTEFQVRQTADGGLEYRVLLHDKQAKVVVGWSKLGIVTKISRDYAQKEWTVSDFTKTIDFVRENDVMGTDLYTMVTGKRRTNVDTYKQMSLAFKDVETGMAISLDVRAYDAGMAFRYVLPEKSPYYHKLVTEKTSFNIGPGGTHWGQAYDFVTMYHPSYETLYTDRPTGSATGAKEGTGWGFPALFAKNGVYVLLHEARLDENFQGSHLAPAAPSGVYTIAPPLAEEALGNGLNEPAYTLPWVMPWRMMVISDKLSDIVESNLVFDLSSPSRVNDESWIKPGIAAWNWWYDHDSGLSLDKLKSFIDLSAEMGWPYTLIDANWNKAAPDAMEQLTAYAKTKGVGLLFWYNSGGRHNYVADEPRNRMADRMTRRAEFAKLEKLGVKGVKIDFWQSDKQDVISQYIQTLEDAAEFHLMVNFHGTTIPRGWQRTWPNLMSMEAIAGAENYTFPPEFDYTHQGPRQNTIIPFTRNVVGSMDYTPVVFSQSVTKRLTTNAHEAALAVVFESGIQHFSDGPKVYPALPPDWRNYLSRVPTAWDETKYLSGTPGHDVVIARRLDKRWYVAGINGEASAKTLKFPLAGLNGLSEKATLLYDDGKGGFASMPWRPTKSSAEQKVEPYGGFVLIFE